jgi:hypothetical protein
MKMLMLCGGTALALMGGSFAFAADCAPKAVHVTAPSFRPDAMNAGDSDALISYRLDGRGIPHAVQVTDFTGDQRFARAAATAVGEWRYDVGGCPTASNETYTVRMSYLPTDQATLRAALNPTYGAKPVNVAATDLSEIVVTSPSREARMQAAIEQGQEYSVSVGDYGSRFDPKPNLTFDLGR